VTATQTPLPANWRDWPAEAKLRLRDRLRYDWHLYARPEQLPPEGDWTTWLVLAGRGFGKTRAGAEWFKEQAKHLERSRGALVASTLEDVRLTMVEGESGLLSILPPSLLRGGAVETAWNRGPCELYFANDSRCKGFSSEKPGRLRGPQHHYAWGDEPAEWEDANDDETISTKGTTWSNLLFGLRLGQNPRVVLTGTPKPVRLVRKVLYRDGLRENGLNPTTAVTRGSTYDNLANLAPTFRRAILDAYEGTTLGQQELHAELLEDNPRALWQRTLISRDRVGEAPAMPKVVVGVDPSGGQGEQGIVVVGKGKDGHGYVLDDRSCRLSPEGWGRQAVLAWADHEADLIAVEVNFGGDMAKATILAAAAQLHDDDAIPTIPQVKVLHASRGKRARAEPVSAVYEQGRVHHVGLHSRLEDQMADWVPDESSYSPDRVDALVWACHELGLAAGQGLGSFGGLAVVRSRLGDQRRGMLPAR
jgi:phage terminase large subunit-like protein